MDCMYCGDDGCEECNIGAREINIELERNRKEYERISIRIKEMYEDLVSNEGITVCFEELIEEMETFNKGYLNKHSQLIIKHNTER